MQSTYKDLISFTAPQKLYVKPEVFRKTFKPTIDALICHVDKLLKYPILSDLLHIIMVGGFSECELVQTAMRTNFPNRKIIIPDEAGLAVLKGAVLFGHQPNKISKRILRKTYGIQTWTEWDPELHPKSKRKELMEFIVVKTYSINLLRKVKKSRKDILIDKYLRCYILKKNHRAYNLHIR
ncbi:unnamed protein product [Mytilus edulis]|uniref:Uncharacterized protein n=1 Tax=Mytilus edulis TaxID=6550 RepID=A0A8S3S3P0_MYTED|nr:unnamed protein product [Mytilus edulis]